MLNQLSVRNVAVIDKLDINLHDGVSVLTGETGAGKSIIIDSINMILGDRANKELVDTVRIRLLYKLFLTHLKVL